MSTQIPPEKRLVVTEMVARYRMLHVPTASVGPGEPAGEKARLFQAQEACSPDGVQRFAADFVSSVEALEAFDNTAQPFRPSARRPPVANPAELWKTNDVSGRLDPASTPRGLAALDIEGHEPLTYVDRELFPMRLTNDAGADVAYSHTTQTASAAASGEGAIPMVRLDLLLRSTDGVPVVGEVKTPTDVDTFYAVVQALTAASQLVTRNQYARLRAQYESEHFVDAGHGGPQVDVAILAVDPTACGSRSVDEIPKATYRPQLDQLGRTLARLLMEQPQVTRYVRRISFVTLRLDAEGQLTAAAS